MRFEELLRGLTPVNAGGDPAVNISGIAYDSRQVQQGFLFVAIPGFQQDGHRFVSSALAGGAAALLLQHEMVLPAGITWAVVPDTRRALAIVAARFYGCPAENLHITGITGTNGKTTTTFLLREVYRANGARTGLIGTIHCLINDEVVPVERTTPESLDLQRLFRQMTTAGVTRVVMEVSSHALALGRITPETIDTAIFTNLTQDHLDFHGNMEDYYQAKAQLFEGQRPEGLAVINADDPYGERLVQATRGRVITYGLSSPADVTATGVRVTKQGVTYRVISPAGTFGINLQLTGLFNVYNTLAVVAAALGEGIPPEVISGALARVAGVPGRFEPISGGQPFTVVVDYAHTPDGLENVLRAARQVARGRVISVFGCGGDRDRDKRPKMGAISGKLADFTVITSDNPRTEDPLSIIAQIEPAVQQTGGRYTTVPDRREAIRTALNLAAEEDIVVIAGKGHETYQIIGQVKYPFSDQTVVREILREMGYTR